VILTQKGEIKIKVGGGWLHLSNTPDNWFWNTVDGEKYALGVKDVSGVPVLYVGNQITQPGSKINILNDNDGLLYTVCCKTVSGQATLYLSSAGNVREKNGVKQFRNDDDGLWYPVNITEVNGYKTIKVDQTGQP